MHVHDSLNLSVITLCSRSRCGAREAMTVGCKPTMNEGLITSDKEFAHRILPNTEGKTPKMGVTVKHILVSTRDNFKLELEGVSWP